MTSHETKNRQPMVGDVFLTHLESKGGNEQHGIRPCIIFQNNTGNKYSPNVIALPLTSSIKKVNQPTHVLIRAEDSGLSKDSMVLCENPETVSKEKLLQYITTIPKHYIEKIAIANILATSAIAFLSQDTLSELRKEALRLNGVLA